MPSNAMKISQLIVTLQGIMDKQGDLDVVVPNQAADRVLAVQHATVVPQASYPWRNLIRPVLSFEPTDDYQATPEESGGWSYDLGTAPDGVRVRIMKRRGGEDEGVRSGDKWAAYEGGERAWEVAPGGVLAWRPL